jgi:phenylalanyl-tRNA synthetase alpha chain
VDELDGLIDKLSAAERRVLLALRELDGSEVDAIREAAGFAELVEVMNASSWLASKGLVTIGERVDTFVTLGPGASEVLESGLPERRVLATLADAGMMAMGDLGEASGMPKEDMGIAMGWLKRRGWPRSVAWTVSPCSS